MAATRLPSPHVKDYAVLGAIVLFIVGVGGLIGYLTGGGDQNPWYQTLNRPVIEPPGIAFGIVWPILYALMSVAVWRIWRLPLSPQRRKGLTLFWIQTLVNFTWSPLFFTLHQIALAAVWIAALVILVVWTMRIFSRLDRISMWLLAPYLTWISFAFVLNLRFWMLNPQMSGL